MTVPGNFFYTKEHEWLKVEDNIGIFGITDYAQDQLGDIVYVELPAEDTEIVQFETCGSIDSVKASSEIYSPVSGRVIEVNREIEDNPAIVNSSPYNDGWLIKIELSSPGELESLMKAKEYEVMLEGA